MNEKLRKKRLAAIHVMKKSLSLSDEDYRSLLESTTRTNSAAGLRSCAGMNQNQLNLVLSRMTALTQNRGGGRRVSTERIVGLSNTHEGRIRSKINALLVHHGLSQAYGDAIARRMYKLSSWRFVNPTQGRAVIAAIVRGHGDGRSS